MMQTLLQPIEIASVLTDNECIEVNRKNKILIQFITDLFGNDTTVVWCEIYCIWPIPEVTDFQPLRCTAAFACKLADFENVASATGLRHQYDIYYLQ